MIDDVERGDAGASRIAVVEPIQSFALDPIPYTVKILSELKDLLKTDSNKRDHVGLIRDDEVRVVCMECERQRKPVDLNGRHRLVPSASSCG